MSLQIPSYTPSSRPTPAEDGPALILLALVLANIRNCSLPSSRIRALDLLLALCAHLTDESKLDRAAPYVVELLRDEVAAVRAAAVKTLMQIVGMVPLRQGALLNVFTVDEGDGDHTVECLHIPRVHHSKRPISRSGYGGLRTRDICAVHLFPRRHGASLPRNGQLTPNPRCRPWSKERQARVRRGPL